jgi:3-(3-hydroxy-phenyl)propionate hydroxylase
VTKTRRSSIYYDYKIYPSWMPPHDHFEDRLGVVIVGAGPSGLVTALKLAQLGVASTVLNAEQQVTEGSRAIVYTRRSMEILHDIGVADRVSQAALPWRFGTSFYRGQPVYRLQAPHDDDQRFFPMSNLQQQFLEQYLLEACLANPLIDIRFANRLQSMEHDERFVDLKINTTKADYDLRCDWLVAADGGRSSIRSALGLRLEGEAFEANFVIVDIRVDLPLPTERLAYFDPSWNPGNTVLVHRQPRGIWRIDYQLSAGETAAEALSVDALRQSIKATLSMLGFPDLPWELDWSSVYSARTMSLPSYRRGRVLFAGDAAHLLPIFGVRGANTAFQDAQSLGWHLAMVAKGWCDESVLDNYSQERLEAVAEIMAESAKSTRFMAPPSEGFRLLRNAVLSLSLSHRFVGPLFHWRTSRSHRYRRSSFHVSGDDDALFEQGPAQGESLIDVRLSAESFLVDYLQGGFCLLLYVAPAELDAIVRVVQSWREHGPPLKLLLLHPSNKEITASSLLLDSDRVLSDDDASLRERYGLRTKGAAYLFRPDQHVAARWIALDAVRLQTALDQIRRPSLLMS